MDAAAWCGARRYEPMRFRSSKSYVRKERRQLVLEIPQIAVVLDHALRSFRLFLLRQLPRRAGLNARVAAGSRPLGA
jgi:hypothetical protein